MEKSEICLYSHSDPLHSQNLMRSNLDQDPTSDFVFHEVPTSSI